MGWFTSLRPRTVPSLSVGLVVVVVATLLVAGFALFRLSSCSNRRPPSCRLPCRPRVALLVVAVSPSSPSFPSFSASFPPPPPPPRFLPLLFVSFPSSSFSLRTGWASQGSSHLRVFRHVGVGILLPSCLLTRRRWDPHTFASFDTSACRRWVVFAVVGLGLQLTGFGFACIRCLWPPLTVVGLDSLSSVSFAVVGSYSPPLVGSPRPRPRSSPVGSELLRGRWD
jgi:hypothetical protein